MLSRLFPLALSESFGVSEVARARIQVASRAAADVAQSGGLVLWLDADMVISERTVLAHAQLVQSTERAISGRYVTRQDERRVAASILDPALKHLRKYQGADELTAELEGVPIQLTSAMTGMGCLMMPAHLFLEQFESSPRIVRRDGDEEIEERLICCPRPVPDPQKPGCVQLLSEDFDYCLSLKRGTWLAEIGTDPPQFLDYGHVAERVLFHKPGARHQFRDDR